MSRLPIPGGDSGNWGDILNDFLASAHNTDGSLKSGAVSGSAITDGVIGTTKLATPAAPTPGQILSYNGSSMQWVVPPSAPVTSVNAQTGAVVLTKTDVGLGDVDNTSDANKPISTATQTALNNKVAKGELVIDVKDYGALGDNTTDDTTAIQAALNAAPSGGIVYLPPGRYRTSAPLIIPPNVTIEGTHGNRVTYSNGSTMQSYIKPLASFSGVACLHMVDKEIGSYSQESVGQRVLNLALDGTALLAGNNVDGIRATGNVREVIIDKVSIRTFTRNGIASTNYTRVDLSVVHPYSWYVLNTIADGCGNISFGMGSMSDTTMVNCESIGPSVYGFYLNNMPNSQLTSCRAEWSGQYGYYITGNWGSGQGSGGLIMTGCSTDRNSQHGVLIDATGTGPVMISGLMLRRDGRNGYPGTGGGNYAGLAAIGATMPVILDGVTCFPGINDDGTGTNSPQNALRFSGNTYVSVQSGYLHAATTPWLDGGGNTVLRRGPNIGEATGSTASPTRVNANNWATDNGSTFTTTGTINSTLNTSDLTGLYIQNASSNPNTALLRIQSGSTGGDVAIKTIVNGDVNSRYTLTAGGTQQWGSGAASADTSLYRISANTLKVDNNVQVTTALGINQTPPTAGIGAASSSADATLLNITNSAANTNSALIRVQTGVSGNDATLKSLVSGDANSRFILSSGGTMSWGPGSAVVDTTLYRSGVGTLRTDTVFSAQTATVSGLTGATAASRYAGATASGAPASGTFAVGDYVIDQSGKVWICTAAGTPGTWSATSVVLESSTAPPATNTTGSTVGVATTAARADHTHLTGVHATRHQIGGADQLFYDRQWMTNGEETGDRLVCASASTLTSGSLHLTYFIARKTETITKMLMSVDATAASGLTYGAIGVYSVDGSGNGTLVASTANDTSAFNTTFSFYQPNLQASWSKVAGTLYAIAPLCTGTTMPSLTSRPGNALLFGSQSPRLTGVITGQSSLPASFTSGSVANDGKFFFAAAKP